MPMARAVEGGQTVVGAVYAEASSVDAAGDAAVEGVTPLVEETYPRPRHRRHLHHFCLESLPGPCVHVVVHTREH
jgi:hypothetical protein